MRGNKIANVSDARLYISIARCFLPLYKISKKLPLEEIDSFVMDIHRSSSLSDKMEDSSVIVEKEGKESVSGIQEDVQSGKGRENVVRAEPSPQIDMAGEISMEASVSADDVFRAGGFGARDDIGSFLPVASDSTDFEATILNARNYEGPQGETSRPGLGWKEATEAE